MTPQFRAKCATCGNLMICDGCWNCDACGILDEPTCPPEELLGQDWHKESTVW